MGSQVSSITCVALTQQQPLPQMPLQELLGKSLKHGTSPPPAHGTDSLLALSTHSLLSLSTHVNHSPPAHQPRPPVSERRLTPPRARPPPARPLAPAAGLPPGRGGRASAGHPPGGRVGWWVAIHPSRVVREQHERCSASIRRVVACRGAESRSDWPSPPAPGVRRSRIRPPPNRKEEPCSANGSAWLRD